MDAISTPDMVETSIGTLKFIDGAPHPETSKLVYEYLDRARGVDAFLKGIPAASVYMLNEGVKPVGIFDKLMVFNSLFLTGNSSAIYVFPNLELDRDGPTVVEDLAGDLGAFYDTYF